MQILSHKKVNFDNTEIAFRSKSNSELSKAYWLFKIISSNFLVQVGPPVTNLFLKIGLPIQGIIKSTIFQQFCGGETIVDCERTIGVLANGKVGTILDYSVEGEEEESVFDFTCAEIIRTVERAVGDSRLPITVFKVTGIARIALLEKIDAKGTLTDAEKAEFEKVKQRCESICRMAYEKNVPIMIDAEETWIQNTIDGLALDMMLLFNREKLIVYNTYQMYRHDKLADLKADYMVAEKAGFILGAKIVRGAYMEKERERAAEKGYPSPIQPDKAATDNDYNAAITFCAENIEGIGLVCGTHNEQSCRVLTDLLEKLDVDPQHPRIYFSQLLGMSDHLSFNLSDAGYNVAKYVPYGPIKAVMPYLFRRAQENTSIAGQTGRELDLILREKSRRSL